MRTLPLVSIITPSFNSAKYIEETIKSVMAQSYRNIEHIVMDGGSKDGTVAILKKYPHLKWVSEKDTGQSNAINKGMRIAKGEIVAWINADDLYAPYAVSRAVDFLQKHPEAVMTYGDCEIIGETGGRIGLIKARPYNEFLHLAWFNVIPQPGSFFRKSAFDKAGGVDETLHYCMDHELWVRLGRLGKLACVDGCLAKFRLVEGTKTFSQNDKFYEDIQNICKKYGVPSLGWTFRKKMKGALARIGLLGTYKHARNAV